MVPRVYKNERGYLELVSDVLEARTHTPDRTSVGGCRKLFNQTLWFDLRESFPASTVRPMSLRYGFEEMMMFLRGETQTKCLEEKGINFWKPQTSKEFQRSRGLPHLAEGDMGKAYGHQIRNYGSRGVDQLSGLVSGLQEDPYSRRHVVNLFNPAENDQGVLQPCWWNWKFNVDNEGGLHLTVHARSADLVFGTPSNYQQYAFLLSAISRLVGLTPGTLVCKLDDVHIYDNQVDYAGELINRDFDQDSKVCLKWITQIDTLDDLLELRWEDIVVEGLNVNTSPFTTHKPAMAV